MIAFADGRAMGSTRSHPSAIRAKIPFQALDPSLHIRLRQHIGSPSRRI